MRNKRGSWERGLVSGGISAAPSAADSWSRPASPLGNGRLAKMVPRVPSPLDMSRDGCLARLPYASLMAFALCTVGVFIFTLMTSWSFNATVEQLRRLLNVTEIPWLDRVYMLFFIVAAAMTVVTAAFLGIGALSTGSTRHEVYTRGGAQSAGRALCVLAMTLASMLNTAWTVVAAVAAVLATVYWALARVCARLPVDGATDGAKAAADNKNACLDFSVFRPLISDYSKATLILCGGAVQQFCALSSTVVVWYALSAFSALLVCLGLLGFIASAAANHAHIGGERRALQLRDILVTETTAAPSSDASAGGGLNSYASTLFGRKMSASRLIAQPPADYQLDGYPTLRQPPHAYGIGSTELPMPKVPSQSALMYYDRRPNAGRSVGAAVGVARRNSYHNSLNDEYNDTFWTRR